MISYIVRRFIQAIVIIVIVSLLVFFMMRLLPGDPVLMYLSQEQMQSLSQEQIEIARHEFGLDRSLIVQYFDWAGGLFKGDLGRSLLYRREVTQLIFSRLPVTLHLGVISLVISTFFGIVLGVISAIRRGKAADLLVTLLANIGITIPIFWLAILFIYTFGLKLSLLPIYGYNSPFEDFWLNTQQIILPIACLSIFSVGAIARQTRSSMLEVVRQDYIRTAWSKGLMERKIILKHVLKNGLIPIVTLIGLQVGQILGGSVLIETVFNISGMGRMAVDAIFSLDFPVVQAVVLLTACMVVLANFIVDISYGWLDPRIRFA